MTSLSLCEEVSILSLPVYFIMQSLHNCFIPGLQKCPHCDQFEECLRAIEKLCEGKMIKIENLSVIASICRDGASLECIEHPLQESLSVKSQLDSQQLFCPVMCQHLLKLKGDPVLILLHFPQIGDETYDSNDMDELFSRVERDTFDIKVKVIVKILCACDTFTFFFP